MRISAYIYISLAVLLIGCGQSKAISPNLETDPSNPKAVELFKRSGQETINPSDLYGLWEAPLGKATQVIYTSRILIEKNFVTLAVKCSFHTEKGAVTEELFALSESEAIITRSHIYVERYNKQTVQKTSYHCTSENSLIHSPFWIDHKKKQLVLETNKGILRLNKIAELPKN